MQPIYIVGLSSLSPLGSAETAIKAYKTPDHCFTKSSIGGYDVWVGRMPIQFLNEVESIRQESSNYQRLDDTVLYAIHCGRNLKKHCKWSSDTDIGLNIGSSRGATSLFEKHHGELLKYGKVAPYTSPNTTLGNIASWVSNDLQTSGVTFSHSVACATGLHSLLNGVAWLQSGLSEYFIAGAGEAPLTPFTLAQMKALRIYSRLEDDYPCRAFDLNKQENTFVLGEGAVLVAMTKEKSDDTLAVVEGVGYATEPLVHGSSISAEATCIQKAMRMAAGDQLGKTDVVVMHSPGTIKGDMAEYNAIKAVFGARIPALTCNKWKIGNTYAASGLLNIEMAIQMLGRQDFFSVPYLPQQPYPNRIKKVLVNAVGFGGNAVSVMLSST